MKFDLNKDYYAILGVTPNATNEEINKAYKTRTKILHPDRFNRSTQSSQWEEANEMQAELNIAFNTLKNQDTRCKYDEYKGFKINRRTQKQEPENQTPEKGVRGIRPSFINYTVSLFKKLPENIQNLILNWQNHDFPNQVKIKTATSVNGYASLVLCPIILLILFFIGSSEYWWGKGWWVSFCFIWTGTFLGITGLKNIFVHESGLIKPYIYLTPLHIIKTSYDKVWIWPLIDINDVEITDYKRNGLFQYRHVLVKFEKQVESFKINTYRQAELFYSSYTKYRGLWNSAVQQSNLKYFEENNDFKEISNLFKENEFNQYVTGKRLQKADVLIVSFLCAVTFFVGVGIYSNENNNLNTSSHAVTRTYPIPKKAILEKSGKSLAAKVEARQKASSTLVPWQEYVQNPEWLKLSIGQKQQLFRDWQKYAISYLIQSQRINNADDVQYIKDNFSAIAEADNLEKPDFISNPVEMNKPADGETTRTSTLSPQARFKVDNTQGDSALIKVVDAFTKEEILKMFVRSGCVAETKVPYGKYEIRYAFGDKWYGYNLLFGSSTIYSKADRDLQFWEEPTEHGTTIKGHSITLYKVNNGNLSTSKISPQDF